MVPERTQARANPARGLALIATAVIVGLFLLRNWDGTGSGVAAAGTEQNGGSDVTTPGATTTAPGGEAPATTVAARPPSELTVRVMNATSVPGAAGRMSDTLTAAQYKTVEPDDAGKMLDTTQILYAPGYEQEAAELARAISSPAESMEALAAQVDPAGATLVVLLGKDLATKG